MKHEHRTGEGPRPRAPELGLGLRWGWTVAALGIGSCDGGKPDTGDSAGEGDADTDADWDCDTELSPEDHGLCATDVGLACDGDRVATTRGGTSVLDVSDYDEWFCWPSFTGDYAGPERVYEFTHPGGGTATVTLESPCDELDLFVFPWLEDECPTGDSIVTCDFDGDLDGDGAMSVDIWESEPGRRYLVVVEGPESPEANFVLHTVCPSP